MSETAKGWRGSVLEPFPGSIAPFARVSIVSDPDALLTDERVQRSLSERGFDVLTAEDSILLRYELESRYRSLWDRAEDTRSLVVRSSRTEIENLPYDLVSAARRESRVYSFGLADIFPNLAPRVLRELSLEDLDLLFEAQRDHAPERLSETGTRNFVLRHVFDLAPEFIKDRTDLLSVLLRRHYSNRPVPASIDDRLLELLRDGALDLQDWPLECIVRSRTDFFAFLQQEWVDYLRSGAQGCSDATEGSSVRFDEPDIRVYIDNLFLEGLLDPVDQAPGQEPPDDWRRVGVVVEPEETRIRRHLKELTRKLEQEIPALDAGHRDWIAFAYRWASWLVLRFDPRLVQPPEMAPLDPVPLEAVHDSVETSFRAWMQQGFAPLHSLPYLPDPVMVHQIPHYLSHVLSKGDQGSGRVALVVVDGLALDQWLILKGSLSEFRLKERGAFAWVPTLTQVTRQAIFAGEPPLFFSKTLGGTFAEGRHWARFWSDAGLPKVAVRYVDPQGKKEEIGEVEAAILEAADDPRCRALGAVVGTIDQNMHQTDLGTGGMHSMIRDWSRAGRLRGLLGGLLERGFSVFLTADHGNVFGKGVGKPNVGSTAKQRGERAHIFESELIRTSVHEQFPGSLEWPQIGLPDDYWVLLAPVRSCFLAEGRAAVSHGGISLEEVIVPFVKVERA